MRLEEGCWDSIRKTYLCGKLQAYLLVTSVSKFLEKSCSQSSTFKRVINADQHGFIGSVASDLVALLSDVAPSVSCREQTDTLYSDCSKAFNRVSQKILVRKL